MAGLHDAIKECVYLQMKLLKLQRRLDVMARFHGMDELYFMGIGECVAENCVDTVLEALWKWLGLPHISPADILECYRYDGCTTINPRPIAVKFTLLSVATEVRKARKRLNGTPVTVLTLRQFSKRSLPGKRLERQDFDTLSQINRLLASCPLPALQRAANILQSNAEGGLELGPPRPPCAPCQASNAVAPHDCVCCRK